MLVCSPGGHLLQLLRLQPAWEGMETTWVTLPAADTDYLLREERVVLGRGPTNRNLRALVSNLRLAWRTVRRERPDVILSTGAALAVPFFLAGKLCGARLVFVESLTRTTSLSPGYASSHASAELYTDGTPIPGRFRPHGVFHRTSIFCGL